MTESEPGSALVASPTSGPVDDGDVRPDQPDRPDQVTGGNREEPHSRRHALGLLGRLAPMRLQSSDRWLAFVVVVTTGCIVGLGIRAATGGWLPVGDNGYFALRSYDVFSRNLPLLGTNSSATGFGTDAVNHPGPLQFILLSVPVRLFGVAAGAAIGTALINAASIALAAWLLRRRWGPLPAMWATVGFAALAWAMGSVMLYDPWGPFAVVLPFGLFVIAAAVAASGDVVALPVAVVAGSLTFQTHLSYVLLYPTLVLAAFAGAMLVTRRSTASRRQRGRRWLIASLGVLMLVWLPPLVDQFQHRPGNFVALWRTFRANRPPDVVGGEAGLVSQQVRVTADYGLEVMAGTIAFPPWWLPPGFGDRAPFFEQLPEALKVPVAVVSLLLLLAGLGWSLRDGLRRGDPAVTGASVIALTLMIVGYVTILRSPWYGVAEVVYVRFLWPTSLWVWFTLALAFHRSWAARTPADGHRTMPLIARRLSAPAAGILAVTVALATLPHVDNSGGNMRDATNVGWQNVGAEVVDTVVDEIGRPEGPVLLSETLSEAYYAYAPLLMAELVERGIDVVVNERISYQAGRHRSTESDRRAPRAQLVILQQPVAEQPGELIYESDGLSPREGREMEELAREIRDSIATLGPAELAPDADTLLAKRSPDAYDQVQRILASAEPTVLDVHTIADEIGIDQLHWNEGGRLDPALVTRWKELQGRRQAEVAIYLIDTP